MVDSCSEPYSCGCPPAAGVTPNAAPRAPTPTCGQAADPLRLHYPQPHSCSCPAIHRDPRTVRVPAPRPPRSWRRPGLAVLVLAAMACALPALSAADRPPSTTPTSTASAGPGDGTGGGTGPHSTPSAMAIFEATSTRTTTPATHHRAHHGHHGAQHANRTMGLGAGQRGRQRHKLDEGLEFDELLGSTPPLMCPLCRLRDEMRRLSLDSIKQQILHKLNLAQAPNMTGRRLPKYEHITQLLDSQPLGLLGQGAGLGMGMGMQGDDPNASGGSFRPGPEVVEEEDDFHAKMEKVIAMPQTREYEHSCEQQ